MSKLNSLSLLASAGLFLSHGALGAPAATSTSNDVTGISCAKWILPVAATADNVIFETPRVDNNIDAANYAWYQDTWSTPNLTERTISALHVDDTFNIGVQLCVPTNSKGSKANILQIATHGLGFDKRYWDPEYEPNTYSYVRAAVRAGYSILTYDRLGTGLSDKPDAYNIVQVALQLEILKELTQLARNGGLAKAAKAHFAHGVTAPNFSKFVHIGHSLGSALTNAFQAKYPELSDGAIQTGWIVTEHLGSFGQAAFGFEYARENDPRKFADRGSGYIVPGTKSSFQQLFLSQALLDPKMLDYGNSIKQPGTVGEGTPAGSIIGIPAPGYKGPVQIFLAERDFPVCDGDCRGIYDVAQLKNASFPSASALDVYVQPKSGHGLALHRNATAGYKVMFDFLDTNGL